MSVTATITAGIVAMETLETNVADCSFKTINHNQWAKSLSLSATSTPAVNQFSGLVLTINGFGAASVNLQAIPGTNGSVFDGSGLKLIGLFVENLGSHEMAIGETGTNLYDAIGHNTIPVGGCALLYFKSGASVIQAGNQMIYASGTAGETSRWQVLLG